MRAPLITIASLAAFAHSPPKHVVQIVARDYTFDAPDTIPAGITTIRFENQGRDMHHVAIVRLEAGHTVAELKAALAVDGPRPDWITWFGGPNAPAPGGTSTATLDLEPGEYLITCLIPSPDSATHAPMAHAAMGMVRPLIVTGVHRPAPLPRADVTMTLVDYGFNLSQPLTSGHHVIRVRNDAAQRHEVALERLLPGKAAADLLAWEANKREGPPPFVLVGGLTPISSGKEANLVVDLEPGEYGLYCFVNDAHDGRMHVAHGMIRQITVAPAGYAAHR